MRVAFETGIFNNICMFVIKPWETKTYLSSQMKMKTVLIQRIFSQINGWKMQFFTTLLWRCCPCNKFGIVDVYQTLKNKNKNSTNFNRFGKRSEIFWWCWTYSPIVMRIMCVWYIYMKLWKIHGKTPDTSLQHLVPFFLDLGLYIEDASNLTLIKYLCLYSAYRKTSFCFCLCLEKKLCTETQIAQPPRQLQGWLRDM